jgi:hypothetical protein
MIEMRHARPVLCCALIFALISSVGSSKAEKADKYNVSIPNLKIPACEVVVSLEITVTAGAFEAVDNMPVGWFFTIDNDASWQTNIKANTTVGAASLAAESLRNLHFIIRKKEFGDLRFSVSGMVSLTQNYEKAKALVLTTKDFGITDDK